MSDPLIRGMMLSNCASRVGRTVVTPESTIVAYCGGEDCEESLRLKDKLAQVGYLNVKVLPNGWTVWRNAGLTTETSPGRSESPGKAGGMKR